MRFTLFIILPVLVELGNCAIYNRYHPVGSKDAEMYHLRRPFDLKIELLAQSGANTKMFQVARQSIIKNFTGMWPNSGYESNDIGEDMEKHFAGAWMVGIFDIDYDAAYTIIRRSPSYLLFGANNRAILIAREGNGQNTPNMHPII